MGFWLRAALTALAILAAAAVTVYLDGGQSEGASDVVRIAAPAMGISTLDIIEDRGVSYNYGFRVEVVRLGTTPEVVAALARGDVEVAVIPVEYVARWAMEGTDLVVIAVDMMQSQAILTVDDGISAPEDLKGRVVGVFFQASTYNMFKAYMELIYGINVVEIKDPGEAVEDAVNTVNVPPEVMIATLFRGDVDAIVAPEPIVSEALARGARVVASFSELYKNLYEGEPVMLVYAARGEWARQNPGLARAVAEARVEAARIWAQEKGYTANLISKIYNIDLAVAAMLAERVKVYQGSGLPDGVVESIGNVLEVAYRGGFLYRDPQGLLESIVFRP